MNLIIKFADERKEGNKGEDQKGAEMQQAHNKQYKDSVDPDHRIRNDRIENYGAYIVFISK